MVLAASEPPESVDGIDGTDRTEMVGHNWRDRHGGQTVPVKTWGRTASWRDLPGGTGCVGLTATVDGAGSEPASGHGGSGTCQVLGH